jgi:hypothetical protein
VATTEYVIEKNVPFPGLEGKVYECLKGKFPDYEVHKGQSLIYQVVVDEALRFQPADPRTPTRGGNAFQTDILVTRALDPKTPLVVVEVKASLTTHDVITYSAKASRHKNVYPYLRYGIAFTGEEPAVIPGRFFTHNSSFDFAISLEKPEANRLPDCEKLVAIVKDQLAVAEHMIKLMNGAIKVRSYESLVKEESKSPT